MKTRIQIQTELILDFLGECRQKDTSGVYHAMLERAAQMAQQTGFQCKGEGDYVYVPSSRQDGTTYQVNGFCQCPAATRDAKHLCKHYALAKAWKHAQERLALRLSHEHLLVCGHATGRVTCYDTACTEPYDTVLCRVCAAGEAETPAEAPDDRYADPSTYAFEMMDDTVLTPAEYAQQEREAPTVDTTEYKSNPSHQHVCDRCGTLYVCWLPADHHVQHSLCATCTQVPALPVPLPEAPCSVNVYLQIQGRRVQVTLRGTDEAAVLARLERVLAQYPTPAYEER